MSYEAVTYDLEQLSKDLAAAHVDWKTSTAILSHVILENMNNRARAHVVQYYLSEACWDPRNPPRGVLRQAWDLAYKLVPVTRLRS